MNATLRLAVLPPIFLLSSIAFSNAQAPPPDQQPNKDQQASTSTDQAQKPSLLTPLPKQKEAEPYHPVSPRQRLRWFITNTIGPPHLFGAGAFSAVLGTALDHPQEYGPHWGGFGDRFGMRLTGVSTGNAMEATIGRLWGEDPRYFAVPDQTLRNRVKNIVRQTFEAKRRRGNYAPAYARYMAVSGNNFLSNTWRVQSEANVHEALIRTVEGFAGRMASNAYEEFWPEIRKRISRGGR